MSSRRKKYSPGYREEAVKLVIDTSRPIAEVARELGLNEGTLGNWVNTYRREHADDEPALDVHERARLREAERQLREVKMENDFLKKAAGVLRPESPVSSKYEFIDGCKCAYPIMHMCRWLEVSRAGFYEWRDRPASATAERRAALTTLIVEIFDDSDMTYGHRRVHAELGRQGVEAGLELVRALMRAQGLVACQPRPWRHSLTKGGAAGLIPDLLARDFSADAPGVKLVGDITYVPTWEGWLYLATVIDCHTKAVIGYAMDDHYKTSLISAAIGAAARNYDLSVDAIFHSDRGSNYTSDEFADTLARLGIRQSVGRTGICYDNAMAESFFASLKNERVHRTVYPTREHARNDIARYIEFRYNTRRIHSGLGYRTPQEVYDEYLDRQQAA
ncbi:MAG: IS3 family transposase [Actinobacteria bacterium]|nr:IS3 family transposase [Actinomycetota bacterium]